MDIESIEQIAFDHMAHRKAHEAREPGFIFYHGRRTARIALKLADQLGRTVDRTVLYTSALFHDVGKGVEPHNEIGARVAREILDPMFAQHELERICQVILLHNQRKQPNAYDLETKIVQDADILDHAGPIAPWIVFYWSAIHSETVDDALRFYNSTETAHTQALMRGDLNLDISVAIFDQRIAFEREFYAALERVHTEGL